MSKELVVSRGSTAFPGTSTTLVDLSNHRTTPVSTATIINTRKDGHIQVVEQNIRVVTQLYGDKASSVRQDLSFVTSTYDIRQPTNEVGGSAKLLGGDGEDRTTVDLETNEAEDKVILLSALSGDGEDRKTSGREPTNEAEGSVMLLSPLSGDGEDRMTYDTDDDQKSPKAWCNYSCNEWFAGLVSDQDESIEIADGLDETLDEAGEAPDDKQEPVDRAADEKLVSEVVREKCPSKPTVTIDRRVRTMPNSTIDHLAGSTESNGVIKSGKSILRSGNTSAKEESTQVPSPTQTKRFSQVLLPKNSLVANSSGNSTRSNGSDNHSRGNADNLNTYFNITRSTSTNATVSNESDDNINTAGSNSVKNKSSSTKPSPNPRRLSSANHRSSTSSTDETTQTSNTSAQAASPQSSNETPSEKAKRPVTPRGRSRVRSSKKHVQREGAKLHVMEKVNEEDKTLQDETMKEKLDISEAKDDLKKELQCKPSEVEQASSKSLVVEKESEVGSKGSTDPKDESQGFSAPANQETHNDKAVASSKASNNEGSVDIHGASSKTFSASTSKSVEVKDSTKTKITVAAIPAFNSVVEAKEDIDDTPHQAATTTKESKTGLRRIKSFASKRFTSALAGARNKSRGGRSEVVDNAKPEKELRSQNEVKIVEAEQDSCKPESKANDGCLNCAVVGADSKSMFNPEVTPEKEGEKELKDPCPKINEQATKSRKQVQPEEDDDKSRDNSLTMGVVKSVNEKKDAKNSSVILGETGEGDIVSEKETRNDRPDGCKASTSQPRDDIAMATPLEKASSGIAKAGSQSREESSMTASPVKETKGSSTPSIARTSSISKAGIDSTKPENEANKASLAFPVVKMRSKSMNCASKVEASESSDIEKQTNKEVTFAMNDAMIDTKKESTIQDVSANNSSTAKGDELAAKAHEADVKRPTIDLKSNDDIDELQMQSSTGGTNEKLAAPPIKSPKSPVANFFSRFFCKAEHYLGDFSAFCGDTASLASPAAARSLPSRNSASESPSALNAVEVKQIFDYSESAHDAPGATNNPTTSHTISSAVPVPINTQADLNHCLVRAPLSIRSSKSTKAPLSPIDTLVEPDNSMDTMTRKHKLDPTPLYLRTSSLGSKSAFTRFRLSPLGSSKSSNSFSMTNVKKKKAQTVDDAKAGNDEHEMPPSAPMKATKSPKAQIKSNTSKGGADNKGCSGPNSKDGGNEDPLVKDDYGIRIYGGGTTDYSKEDITQYPKFELDYERKKGGVSKLMKQANKHVKRAKTSAMNMNKVLQRGFVIASQPRVKAIMTNHVYHHHHHHHHKEQHTNRVYN